MADLLSGGLPDYPMAVLIDCVRRELRLRHQVYPRRIGKHGFTQAKADEEIARMAAVLRTLEALESKNPPG